MMGNPFNGIHQVAGWMQLKGGMIHTVSQYPSSIIKLNRPSESKGTGSDFTTPYGP